MEVLIATFILSLVIIVINLSCKQFFDMQGKMQHMENVYLSALSLKDRIESGLLDGGMAEAGEINGLSYRYTVSRVAENNNYLHGVDNQNAENTGPFRLRLLRVELNLAGRAYKFFTTRAERNKAER